MARIGVSLGVMVVSTWALGSSLLPELPKARANASEEYKCVEPVAEMRRNHMQKMLHQRDLTLRQGIRTKPSSLVRCINCHISADERGQYPKHTSAKHFCNACHQFAGVRIDCFECHTDRPDPNALPTDGSLSGVNSAMADSP